MVRIASPLTLLMLTSRHCGPATGGQHKEILVIHSSFLMRLLSHNPLSTPFDPPVLGDREEELGDTPKPPAKGLRPLCVLYLSHRSTACCASTPAGPISSPSTGEDQGEGNGRRAGREERNPPPLSPCAVSTPFDPPFLGGDWLIWGTPPNPRQEVSSCTSA
jgi:hypothetical protein